MSPLSVEARVSALIERMRSDGPRWQHSYGSLDVVYASTVDDWADELEALLVGRPTREESESTEGVAINGPTAKAR